MSGLTEDHGSPTSADAAARRLFDPAFKLFGRTIPVSSDCKGASSGDQEAEQKLLAFGEASSVQDLGDETPESEDESSVPDELGSSSGSNDGVIDEEKVVEVIADDPEDSAVHDAGLSEQGGDNAHITPGTEGKVMGDDSGDQAPKKPDKPIACPRCHSLDTKFCYFNNYNINQPRHFCKNCQRYWTAGGTLRNVPVGAGRRKNKHSSPHVRSALADVVLVRSDPPENAQQLLSCPGSAQVGLNRHLKGGVPPSSGPRHILPLDMQSVPSFESPPSSAVLSFGQESPVCRSTGGTPFNPCRSDVLQGYKPDMSQVPVKRNPSMPLGGLDAEQKSHDEKHCKDTSATAASVDVDAKLATSRVRPSVLSETEVPLNAPPKAELPGVSGIPKYADAALAWATGAPFPFMGAPWQYGTGLGWGNTIPPATHVSAGGQGVITNSAAALANLVQGATTACNAVGASHHQAAGGFGGQQPWAAAMGPWSGGIPWPLMQNPLWAPTGWGGPWTMPWAAPFTAAAAAAAANPDLGTTVLGKHPREQMELDLGRGGPLVIPKTLRIDDPGEAARSSIWSTLGIDLRPDALSSGGIFRDLHSKPELKESNDPLARTRNSNPAARNRSLSFQENNLTSPMMDSEDK